MSEYQKRLDALRRKVDSMASREGVVYVGTAAIGGDAISGQIGLPPPEHRVDNRWSSMAAPAAISKKAAKFMAIGELNAWVGGISYKVVSGRKAVAVMAMDAGSPQRKSAPCQLRAVVRLADELLECQGREGWLSLQRCLSRGHPSGISGDPSEVYDSWVMDK